MLEHSVAWMSFLPNNIGMVWINNRLHNSHSWCWFYWSCSWVPPWRQWMPQRRRGNRLCPKRTRTWPWWRTLVHHLQLCRGFRRPTWTWSSPWLLYVINQYSGLILYLKLIYQLSQTKSTLFLDWFKIQ